MPLTIEQVNLQAADIDARMGLPSSDPNHLSLADGRTALFALADELDVSIPSGATAVFYSGDFRARKSDTHCGHICGHPDR